LTPPAPTRISVDGKFEDWLGVPKYVDEVQATNNDIAFQRYGLILENGYLSFYLEVKGIILGDNYGYDSFFLFVDADGENSTGYFLRNLGAEYMVEIFGGNNTVASSSLYEFEGDDEYNWSAWNQIADVQASSYLDKMEVQIYPNDWTVEDDFLVLLYANDNEGNLTYSSISLGKRFGALAVTQRPLRDMVSAGVNDLLELEYKAFGSNVSVLATNLRHIGAGSVIDAPSGFNLTAGEKITRTVRVDTTASPNGSFVSLSLLSVEADRPVSIRGEAAKAYVNQGPFGNRIDGWFGDWKRNIGVDVDPKPITNENIDIDRYSANLTQTEAYFYLDVKGEILGGAYVPFNRMKPPPTVGQPAPPQPPRPLPKKSGEDILRIYVDSNSTDNECIIVGNIRADYLVEIKGIYGRILSKSLFHWEDGWKPLAGKLLAEKGREKLEVSFNISAVDIFQMKVVYETTDWKGEGDTSEALSLRGEKQEITRSDGKEKVLMPEFQEIIVPVAFTTLFLLFLQRKRRWNGGA